MPKKNAESKSKGKDKKISVHKKGEEGSEVSNEKVPDVAQGNAGNGNVVVNPEKERLLALYQTLKDLGINSIGDLEVKISRL